MNKSVQSRSTRWVSGESVLAESLAQLDATEPGWDEDLRVAGACRRLRKSSSSEAIRAAVAVFGEDTVRTAMRRLELPLGDLDTSREQRGLREEPFHHNRSLSSREMEVFKALSKGFSDAEIARSLDISQQVARVYRKTVLDKLRAAAEAEAQKLQQLSRG